IYIKKFNHKVKLSRYFPKLIVEPLQDTEKQDLPGPGEFPRIVEPLQDTTKKELKGPGEVPR
ncbi:hypothetical protein TNCT_529901, partial [Trichonephila clavata]